MRQIKTADDIRHLGTILTVWAHPDDESFSSAGIIAAAISNGQSVICITATKGEAGVQDESRWPAAKLGEIRAEEMHQACKILGITDHHWLGYHDGKCDQIPDEEAAQLIKDFIDKYQPDTILTFGPDGMTGHPDHQSVSRWVDLATRGTQINVYHSVEDEETYENYLKEVDRQFNIFFNIDKPPTRAISECDLAFRLTPELIEKKYKALAAMPSQTESMLKNMTNEDLSAAFGCECYVRVV